MLPNAKYIQITCSDKAFYPKTKLSYIDSKKLKFNKDKEFKRGNDKTQKGKKLKENRHKQTSGTIAERSPRIIVYFYLVLFRYITDLYQTCVQSLALCCLGGGTRKVYRNR